MFFNLKGTSLLSLPEPIKKLVQELSDNFNFRLYKCYVLGMSFIMRLLYKFVCSFIGQPNEDKIIILDGRKDKHLFDDFNPDNLEKRFGGRAENLVYGGENSLFPPRVPTDNIFFPYENPRNILITEEEYISRCKKGLIPKQSISPYILDKLNEEQEEMQIQHTNTITNSKKEDSNKNNVPLLLLQKNNNYDKKLVNNQYRYNLRNQDNIDISLTKTNIQIKNKKIIKDFLSLTDWKIGEQFIEDKIHKKIYKYELQKEFEKFSVKKNNFIKNIVKVN